MKDNLTKSLQYAECCKGHLLDTLKTSGTVEGIILLQLIEQAARLAGDIAALRSAIEDRNP